MKKKFLVFHNGEFLMETDGWRRDCPEGAFLYSRRSGNWYKLKLNTYGESKRTVPQPDPPKELQMLALLLT